MRAWSRARLRGAVFAKSEEFMAVVNYLKVLFFGFGVLQFLDVIVFKLNNFSTANADEVIVVLATLSSLIKLLATFEILFF